MTSAGQMSWLLGNANFGRHDPDHRHDRAVDPQRLAHHVGGAAELSSHTLSPIITTGEAPGSLSSSREVPAQDRGHLQEAEGVGGDRGA